MTCPYCNDREWVHVEEPFEIQGCNDCDEVLDQRARAKHKTDHPECEWPDHDLYYEFMCCLHYLKSKLATPEITAHPEITLKVDEVIQIAKSKISFPSVLSKLPAKLGEIVEMVEFMGCSDNARKHLERSIAIVAQSIYRTLEGKWTLGHALGPNDGDFQADGQWRVRKLSKDQ